MPPVTHTAFVPSPPARPHVLTFRVSESELTYLDALADEHEINRSEVIRAFLAGRILVTDPPVPSGPMTDVEV